MKWTTPVRGANRIGPGDRKSHYYRGPRPGRGPGGHRHRALPRPGRPPLERCRVRKGSPIGATATEHRARFSSCRMGKGGSPEFPTACAIRRFRLAPPRGIPAPREMPPAGFPRACALGTSRPRPEAVGLRPHFSFVLRWRSAFPQEVRLPSTKGEPQSRGSRSFELFV